MERFATREESPYNERMRERKIESLRFENQTVHLANQELERQNKHVRRIAWIAISLLALCGVLYALRSVS